MALVLGFLAGAALGGLTGFALGYWSAPGYYWRPYLPAYYSAPPMFQPYYQPAYYPTYVRPISWNPWYGYW